MRKRVYIPIIIVIVLGILFGICWYWTSPRYEVIQQDRSISLTGSLDRDFVISPAKIKITNLWKSRPLTFNINVASNTGWDIEEGIPSIYDEGYGTNYLSDYQVSSVSTGNTIKVNISKNYWKVHPSQEMSFAISENATDSSQITIGRSYIMEILLP